MSGLPSDYVGRFAPSPTGPLHLGSLVAALASYLDAKSHQGQWLLRVEDIDPPREQPGARSAILKSLEAHHLFWDGEVLYQSQRSEAYRSALQILDDHHLSYRCTCSRQDMQQPREAVYSGHCRHLHYDKDTVSAIRLNIDAARRILQLDAIVTFDDVLQGSQHQNILTDIGDFVIHRKDGFFAYQLAVVIDDIFQGITHVIRGADLLDSTVRQIVLFRLFNAPTPVFGHVPLVLNNAGQKLSKQNMAPALDDITPTINMFAALQRLNLLPPAELKAEPLDVMLNWAIQHWQQKL